MKTKVYSVRLKSLTEISPKCLKAIAFDGSEAFIPKSVFFGNDYDVQKSNAYWIAAWFLDKPENKLQYSDKKEGWFNPDKRTVEPSYYFKIEHHKPDRIEPIQNNFIQELKK